MNRMKHIIGLLLVATLFAACTEDRANKALLKYEVYSKDQIDTQSDFLYVALGEESSRTSLHGRAFQVGQTKVVNLEINEFSLDVVAIEKDPRFKDNPANRKLMISIPIEHVDYRCADDAYGECLGEEVTNERIAWNQRQFIIPKFEEAKILDTNFFPYEFAPEGDSSSCYKTNKTELLKRAITQNEINFTLRREYKDQLYFFCFRNHDLSDFNNLNWAETTSYSIVKLDQVASPNYQGAVYNREWERTFGFFPTENYKLDIDGNATQDGEVQYMQRWNPNRSEITYYLSESFNKPENQVLKAATYESFARINQGLAQAGAKFRLNLQEPNPNIEPGDLRNSMIILVDDPVASSVIGYGPSVANPLTGEVISARTIMYSGSIKKFVRYTYDEILREHRKALAKENGEQQEESKDLQDVLAIQVADSNNSESNHNMVMLRDQNLTKEMTDFSKIINIPVVNLVDRTPHLTEAEVDEYMDQTEKRDYLMELAGENKYPAEALSFGDINQEVVQEMIVALGELQPWETLSNANKQKVLDVLVPYVWVPTLVHEVGHNLGLRHNFAGSEDQNNYYSKDELGALAVPISNANIPYSSVMDYPKSEINALRTLGKYDIAALRFGYAEQVEMADGSLEKVNPSEEPSANLKIYKFCTDDMVAPNPNCNPFDEGTTIVEITQSLIDSYKEGYERNNFRRGRANYSSFDDDYYIRRISRIFGTMRIIYERYESLIRDFQVDQETIDSVPFLKDIDDATVLAADFMMNVIATPDTSCIIQLPDGNLQLAPIGMFSSLAHDRTRQCSNLQLNEGFTVVGEGGKPLNSYRLPSNPNNYADQIDVRGVWMDKALAMRTLFRRTMNSSIHNDSNGNFIDHPKVAPKLVDFIVNMMSNNLSSQTEFTLITGEVVPLNVAVNFEDDFYEVPASELRLPSRMLNLPYKNMYLPEILGTALARGIYSGSKGELNERLKGFLAVYTEKPDESARYVSVPYGSVTLYVPVTSAIAAQVALQANRAEFYESTRLPMESLRKVLALLENGTNPVEELAQGEENPEANPQPGPVAEQDPTDGLTPAEKAVYDRGADELKAYLDNPTRSDYMKKALSVLALN